MELDDFKNSWAEYDKKLSKNLRFNEELLQKMNLNSSRREMQKLLIYEVVSIFILIFLIFYILSNSIYYIYQLRYSIPGFIGVCVALIYLAFSFIRINDLLNIDYYGSAVVKVQKRILSLKRKTLRFRKYELILLPILVLPIIPIMFKAIHNIDIYRNLRLLIIEIVVVIGLAFPLFFWINKSLYDKKFKNAESLLKELEKFEDKNEK